jgi:TM2 domain-containing membrane protein YozV
MVAEFIFMVIFLAILSWALFLTNHLGRLRKRNAYLEKQYFNLLEKNTTLKTMYEKSYSKAFEAGKQFAYQDMAKEIKNTIKKAQDDA